MLNTFEESDIIKIINDNLKCFFDKMEKYILASGKIEKEESMKQYIIFKLIFLDLERI
jgi:hypothetical protein